MTISLEGRVALVTGGSRGIGAAIARRLSELGATVMSGARSANEVTEGPVLSHPLDVASTASVDAFFAWARNQVGEPDILVNAAGVTADQITEGHPEALWREVIDTNLLGPFRMIRAALPAMKAMGHGAIINIASTAARTAEADHAAYCASKAGLVGLTRAVALEGAPHGITCVAVSPSWVETEMLRNSAAMMAKRSGRTAEEEIAAIAGQNPQHRLVQPDEVAELVAFLCAGRVPGLTMEDIQISGGALW